MRRSLRNLRRLLRIARTLAHHDALFPLPALGARGWTHALARILWRPKKSLIADLRPGERLARALEALGPSFIKFGQALSTRPDVVGRELADDLSRLRDRLPPFPAQQARATIEAELGRPLDQIFASFDDDPVAAASIAQVHFAVTGDGDEVAVKIQRPGLEAAFARDLELFRWLAETAERTRPTLRRLRPQDTVETLAEAVRLEMDLRLEAAAASELAENAVAELGFHVPKVDWARTARRVLTTERIAGIPIDDRAALIAAGHDPAAVAGKLIGAFLTQAFRHGFFHADLHQGNLFVDEGGEIGAVDFGIMGRLDRHTRRYVAELLLAFLTGDYRRAAEVHFEAGYVSAAKSVEVFAQACRSIAEPILDQAATDVSMGRLLAQLFEITETFDMQTQPQLLLLQKTMVVVEGVARTLAPDINTWDVARPYFEDFVRETAGAEARVREAAESTADLARRIPLLVERAEEATTLVARGGLRLHPETARAFQDRGGRRIGTGQLLLWAVVIGLLAGLLFKD